MDLLKLIDNYGRACRRDGNPAWESDEGKALKSALESRASNAGGAVWIQRDHLEKAKMGAYLCRVEAEYRDGMGFVPLYPAPASKEPVADERAALYQAIHDALMEHGLSYTEDTGSGEKFPLVDKLCAPGDKTIQTGKDEIAILAETILDAIPPVRAALATAQPLWRSGGKDTERLDWLAQHGAWIAWGRDGEMCRVFHHSDDEDGRAVPFCGWGSGKCYPTAREAIDAAMLAAAPAKPEGV